VQFADGKLPQRQAKPRVFRKREIAQRKLLGISAYFISKRNNLDAST
jgi:hypothetical protein